MLWIISFLWAYKQIPGSLAFSINSLQREKCCWYGRSKCADCLYGLQRCVCMWHKRLLKKVFGHQIESHTWNGCEWEQKCCLKHFRQVCLCRWNAPYFSFWSFLTSKNSSTIIFMIQKRQIKVKWLVCLHSNELLNVHLNDKTGKQHVIMLDFWKSKDIVITTRKAANLPQMAEE